MRKKISGMLLCKCGHPYAAHIHAKTVLPKENQIKNTWCSIIACNCVRFVPASMPLN